MNNDQIYDCAIIGGGLGGLTLAINLRKSGFKILLIEKETYPFHKVCGEYISMESWDYLEELGLPLSVMNLPTIDQLIVTAPDGTRLEAKLESGGFGVSRYQLDSKLCELARQSGVVVKENCKVDDVRFTGTRFEISTSTGYFYSGVCCGCFGKRSNIDVKMKRDFISGRASRLNNFIAVKYHVLSDENVEEIALHNFPDGYCGFSKIEENKYCLCYLTTAANLKSAQNSIPRMERDILSTNPVLKQLFEKITVLYDTPLSISQVSFQKKAPVENHILMIGDAAGLITPLCGNGMSMAIHAGKIASSLIKDFLENKLSREEMEIQYRDTWNQTFSSRMATGRFIQRLFGKRLLTNLFVRIMKRSPALTQMLIRRTHGLRF